MVKPDTVKFDAILANSLEFLRVKIFPKKRFFSVDSGKKAANVSA